MSVGMKTNRLEDIALEIRQKIFKTGIIGQAGHIASSFSMVEIITILYFSDVLKYNVANPKQSNRDRFILSKGHGALALYATLAKAGFFSEKELDYFCKPNSKLGCHPKNDEINGVEASTGALGHGMPFGVGIALASKLDDEQYKTYVLMGDGECQEGSVWEAAITAAHHNLSNFTAIIDYNKLQASQSIEMVSNLEPFALKWESFGFHVIEVDGHDFKQLQQAFAFTSDRPKVIIAHTVKGKGVSYMENQVDWHTRLPKGDEIKQGAFELKIPENEVENL